MNKKRKIYLDYAATTPIDERVFKKMLPYFSDIFGNPSSLHQFGQEARAAVDEAREKVANCLNCSSSEIIFTGTTTTSTNLAIQGLAQALKEKGNHIITSAVEHHAVLDTCKVLEKQGFKLTILPVDQYGSISLEKLEKSIREETILISIIYANNEMGTIQPIQEIGKLVRKINKKREKQNKVPLYLHSDGATAAEYLSLDVKELGVDLFSLGGHKFHGPKGVGILYIKKNTPILPLVFGGHHERGKYPGTENVPGIVGIAEALEISAKERGKSSKKVIQLRDKLIKGVLESISNSKLTGHPEVRLPDIASFIFKGVEGESILLMLDQEGIAASSGSACTSGALEPSHVLKAMNIPRDWIQGSIRFSLGKETKGEEIDFVLKALPGIIARLRKMSPIK